MPENPTKPFRIWMVLGGIGVAIFIGFMAGPHMCPEETIAALDVGGTPEEIHLIETDGLAGVIVAEDVEQNFTDNSFSARKYSVFELAGGRRVATITVDRQTSCFGIAADRLWCENKEYGLHARDPVSLQKIWDQAALGKADPPAKGGFRKNKADYEFDEGAGRLLLMTDQGYYYYLDPGSLKLTQAPDDTHVDRRSYSPMHSYAQLSDTEQVTLSGRERKHLKFGEHKSDSSFLRAEFLIDRRTYETLLFPGTEPSLVMAHWTRLDNRNGKRGLQLSRVTPKGKVHWTVDAEGLFPPPDDDNADCSIFSAYNAPQGLLVVFVVGERGYLVMLDPATGAIRWKHGL